MSYANDVTATIGHTPLVKINRILPTGTGAKVLAKMEFTNPGGSVKDRPGLAIIRAAEASGALQPGGTIVEATSGNTGVALCMVGAALGYRVVISMPSSMSVERRQLMKAYGAELLLTDPAGGMAAAVKAAEDYLTNHPEAVFAGQFDNPANPEIHYRTTGPEIWEQTEGHVDAFVAGVGSGGTVSGVGKFLKEQSPEVWVVAVEPAESALLSTGQAGAHKIQGIGANFVPDNYDRATVDEVITVSSDDAIETARKAATQEGLLVGISSGANLAAATALAARPEFAGKTVVTLLPDTGERYLSTVLFAHLGD
ncbi:cysteine synthase A [Mobiluncus curtisii]|uniref:cysteine synthase A n=1 Tax=Mobiluncus curtisii TaxID=2051 RepID=UPI0014706688|nr:cysteine synthase A [Mobiluncus curtisii]NMW43070.1 cysteine synthase A [Mobiluncus curtisii]NMW46238.1 cysteine synthase A [Mobiluncus curtisii]NMW83903.1 cysteine synthase A [Mobiluncus curtisii]NMW99657.1 cysteine synthase A [Mobiluncus curtisii]NMX04816.1 cysteine synthase A [Mobiluncus curtisii]